MASGWDVPQTRVICGSRSHHNSDMGQAPWSEVDEEEVNHTWGLLTNQDVVLILSLIFTHFFFTHFFCKRNRCQLKPSTRGSKGPSHDQWGSHEVPVSKAFSRWIFVYLDFIVV